MVHFGTTLFAVIAVTVAHCSGLVEIKSPPRFVKQPLVDELHFEVAKPQAKDKPFSIECVANGEPVPSYHWIKDGKPFDWQKYHDRISQIPGVGTLVFQKPATEDAGQYQCFAENEHGIATSNSISAILIVRRPTRIVHPPASYEAKSGTSVTFMCVAVADPSLSLSIEWKRNGESIDFDSELRYIVANDNSLTISRTTALDSGNYTCLARTEFDEDVRSATLIVQDIPNPPRIVEIECTNEVSIEWAPMGDNGAPILGYSIQRNTSCTPDLWETIANDIPPTRQTHKIPMTPYTNSTFRVIAWNKIGLSLPSQQTKTCSNQQKDVPARNPHNVKGRGTNPSNIVISWEAMPQIEHNAPGFMYRVFYKLDRSEDVWTVVDIHDWTTHSLQVDDQPTFQRYQIKVVALNEMGESKISPKVYIGYSGEDVPLQAPGNFTLLEVIGSSAASFSWEIVPEDSVRGFVVGYKIQTWIGSKSDETIQEIRIIGNSSTAVVSDLIPNNLYHARIFVYNDMYNGPPSEILNFTTPEDVPGPVETFSAYPEGCCTLNLAWRKPASPNGIITGYKIYYQVVEGVQLGVLLEMTPSIPNPDTTTASLSGLQPETKYRIHVSAVNNAGEGRRYMLEEQTLGSNSQSSESLEYD